MLVLLDFFSIIQDSVKEYEWSKQMSSTEFDQSIIRELEDLRKNALYKNERLISGPQDMQVQLNNEKHLLNFCANNYLGLSNHPALIQAAKTALDEFGFGLSSVRFICGTQTLHKKLEQALSDFIGTEDCILYSSCFDANGGLFETLFDKDDAIISDSLNHASIIDGIRLCKAKRYRYLNNDMNDLETKLKQARTEGAKHLVIATDGVFSMDGFIANLQDICRLAEQYDALVMMDDCHATGFLGQNGKGSHEYCGVLERVDIITGTLGKALGGASGGYVCSRKPIIEKLRQRSRPYLFSNALAPVISAASLTALDIIQQSSDLRTKLQENTNYFRSNMKNAGFDILPGHHPIVPVMFYDAPIAQAFSERLLEKGIFAINFSYPVVPQGKARIRLQLSAAHTREQLDFAIQAFVECANELKFFQ